MPTAVIIGGTGLIGQELIKTLLKDGFEVKLLSRSKSKVDEIFGGKVTPVEWNGKNHDELVPIINSCNLIVNLAGHTIAIPWTKSNKNKIWNSRINTTEIIANAINSCNTPPKVLIQASAVGYYSHNSWEQLTENSSKGAGFLSNLTDEWEQQALKCESKTRVVLIRTGIVLSNKGGFLPKILSPIKYFAGTILGSGKQIIPWIHIHDHISAIVHLAKTESATGAFNLVDPNPTSLSKITKTVGKIVNRPIFLRIPASLLRLALGNMAKETLLASQTVKPKKLEELGFEWRFADIEDALTNLLVRNTP
ncbi:MAG TPA: TIGR01777 family oxidoreductase [Tenuifilaceae bacterium]|nr:TIGR01777 family oxidoreductase [Tenuifilaceae bacterium]HPI44624.1 TIGR01777 family oxidoreductase [Tenuifilaceae bacterium]HPN20283.1 TIGR01777 family oxidoreductase [Tenuifilaceae bacterium]HPV57818.1 TIGR01777 family oxidoreductase [Tenuifilaceae bacterium]